MEEPIVEVVSSQTHGPARTPPRGPHVLLATVPLNWGFNFIIKVIKQDFSVMGLLRSLLMVVALFITLYLFERDLSIRREHLRYFIGFSIVTVAIYQYCFTAGAYYALASEAAADLHRSYLGHGHQRAARLGSMSLRQAWAPRSVSPGPRE